MEELNCHYCRLVASLRKVLRYLYKYLHKGPDTSASAVAAARSKKLRNADPAQVDEVREYQFERNVVASEAAWRILGFCSHDISPTVRVLYLDDDGRQSVVVPDQLLPPAGNARPEDVQRLRDHADTQLSNADIYFLRPRAKPFDNMLFVQYFEQYAGTMYDDAADVPRTLYDTAYEDQRVPSRRVYPRTQERICRVPPVGPGRGEKFFLYILLKNRPARSYTALKTASPFPAAAPSSQVTSAQAGTELERDSFGRWWECSPIQARTPHPLRACFRPAPWGWGDGGSSEHIPLPFPLPNA